MTMKVIVLGGFLGSGKTSVLLQLAEFLVARSIKKEKAPCFPPPVIRFRLKKRIIRQ